MKNILCSLLSTILVFGLLYSEEKTSFYRCCSPENFCGSRIYTNFDECERACGGYKNGCKAVEAQVEPAAAGEASATPATTPTENPPASTPPAAPTGSIT